MMKDTPGDPYTVGGSSLIVLTCTECGTLAPVGGTRRTRAGTPDDPLCTGCFAMYQRVWGDEGTADVRLRPIGPAVIYAEQDTGRRDPGLRRSCPRCSGRGATPWGICFTCQGERWIYVFLRDVRRTARWSQTYQQNRQPEKE